MVTISASVGQGGVNRFEDVRKVQRLLKLEGTDPGPIDGIDGIVGPRTIGAIFGFQHRFLTRPDGRIDPGGRTLARLNGPAVRAAPRRATPAAPARPATQPPSARVVGRDWTGDSQQWSQDKKLGSLQPGFRTRIVEVVRQLKAEGFRPTIVFGWRSVAKQQELFRRGVTKVRFSFHNAQTPQGVANAWAVDLVDERWAWNEPDCHRFFKALGRIGKAQGLVWGGDWVSFRDWAHLQGRQNSELATVKRESGL